jgi:transcriptional regulator with XRE-family HTH domain
MNFGQRLRKLREEKGDTQKQLARVLNVSESTIGMYERGEREPNFETLNKIANYFGVPVDYLMGRTENPKSKKITFEDLDKDERDFVEQVREVAAEYGYELSDPEFVKIFRAALDFAKRVRGTEDQDNHNLK